MQKAPVEVSRTKGPRYTPVSKRQDKPDGIAWIIRNHPEISDAQIGKLIGTTRNTIAAIRDRSHWNISNIQPKDPVTLGLCSQRELDAIVAKAAKKAGHRAGAVDDQRMGDDREALIEELRAERDTAARDAEPRIPSRKLAKRHRSSAPPRTCSRAEAASPDVSTAPTPERGLQPQGSDLPARPPRPGSRASSSSSGRRSRLGAAADAGLAQAYQRLGAG